MTDLDNIRKRLEELRKLGQDDTWEYEVLLDEFKTLSNDYVMTNIFEQEFEDE
tara:strand:+ start:275 stop:433 length:159 start_codon:yes stop_codon:yes gene_type:complete